jgi:hypothetical protein
LKKQQIQWSDNLSEQICNKHRICVSNFWGILGSL